MELKAIIAIALVVFIIGGLIFLKVRSRKKYPARGGHAGPPLLHTQKERSVDDERTI